MRQFITKKNILIFTVLILVSFGFYFLSQNLKKIREEEPEELKIEILKEGSGPAAKEGDTISIHYLCTLKDGTKIDSTQDKGKPFVFTLGARTVIEGWNLGISGMKLGEKRRLTIPSRLAYGEKGFLAGQIPPNTTLIFEVELMSLTSFTNE